MKLICLNIWGGKIYNPLIKFLKDNLKDTDIFCLQEILDSEKFAPLKGKIFSGANVNIYKELKILLANYKCFFDADFDLKNFGGEVDFPVQFGKAIYVKKSIHNLRDRHIL